MDHAHPRTHAAPSQSHAEHGEHAKHQHHYGRLALMALLSFAAMYVLMYAMVNTFDNVLPNVNQFYMAGLMAAPMVIIELVFMGMMYPNKRANLAIGLVSTFVALAFWFAIRTQAGIGNEQFLKSMVPHHAGAILMCEKAEVSDPEIRKLCAEIIKGQQSEIEQMKALLREQNS
jgi:uncharacterized protein (DUF305 family)